MVRLPPWSSPVPVQGPGSVGLPQGPHTTPPRHGVLLGPCSTSWLPRVVVTREGCGGELVAGTLPLSNPDGVREAHTSSLGAHQRQWGQVLARLQGLMPHGKGQPPGPLGPAALTPPACSGSWSSAGQESGAAVNTLCLAAFLLFLNENRGRMCMGSPSLPTCVSYSPERPQCCLIRTHLGSRWEEEVDLAPTGCGGGHWYNWFGPASRAQD